MPYMANGPSEAVGLMGCRFVVDAAEGDKRAVVAEQQEPGKPLAMAAFAGAFVEAFAGASFRPFGEEGVSFVAALVAAYCVVA